MTRPTTLLKSSYGFILLALSSFVGGCSDSTPKPAADVIPDAKAIHEASIVLDAHVDIVLPTTSAAYLDADGLSKATAAKIKSGNMGAVVMTAGVGPGPRTEAGDLAAKSEVDEKLHVMLELIEQQDNLVLATNADDVSKARKNQQTAVILGFQNARALQQNIETLDAYYAAGVRVFGLNHMGHNAFSDSSRPIFNGETKTYEVTEEHGGLSTLGQQAIERISSLGGIVDVSQMSRAATLQAVELATRPVIASHSNVKVLSDVTRNLSDEEIDAIASKGGVIHLAAFGAYLVDLADPNLLAAIRQVRIDAGLPEAYSYPYELYWELETNEEKTAFVSAMRDVIGRGNVDRLIDHIDYVVSRVGIDLVGIGSDFNHGGGIEGFMNASEALNVTQGLLDRGYSADDIRKIWGDNFLRVFQSVAKE